MSNPKLQYAMAGAMQGPTLLHIVGTIGVERRDFPLKAFCGKTTPLLIKSGVKRNDPICPECEALSPKDGKLT